MKALVVCGSGTEKGYTEAMCRGLARGLKDEGIETTVLYPSRMDIGYVSDKNGEDDMGVVLSEFGSSDICAMATPIYFNGISSVLKTVIDRFNPYWKDGGPHPRHMAGMLCGGSPAPDFSHALSVMRSLCNSVGSEWLGQLEMGDSDRLGKGAFERGGEEFGHLLAQSIKSLGGRDP